MNQALSALTARRGFMAAVVMAAALFAIPALAQDQPAASGDQEALKIELPQPAFGGTPLNYFGPNLEPVSFKKRPPFLAPKGAENLAKGKTVTASSEPTMGELAQITDGDKEAYEKALVELKPGKQWVQIDLGQESTLYAILVWHFFAYDRVYFDVVVQVSNDPEFQKDVTTVYNNDIENGSGLGAGTDKEYVENYEGRLMDAKGVKGRYVRLYTKGNTTDAANHYIEVEVYGVPAA